MYIMLSTIFNAPDRESSAKSPATGCLWKYPAGALYLEQRLRRAKHITPASKVCVPIPSNHGAAWYWFTPTLCQGGTVVYPGPSSSDPSAIVRALRLERCTDAIVVPTMVHALALAAQSSSSSSLELGCLSLAGSPCTPAHLDEAMRALGARTVENAWGMTENVLIPSGACADPKTVLLDEARRHVSVGTVPDGLRLKVCAPGGYDPVPRGTPGELHFSSRILTREYIGIESPGFYDDDDERDDARWFRTGDQARIDADGRVFVVGRYKDMIIRGAENMAPAAIEAVIATEERLGSSCLDVQVVGCPDAVAGEVPVVVSREALAARLFELLRETVAARMGPQYVPVEVLTLRDLGLDEWPRTIIGKLQKNQVAARVRQYVERRDALSLAGRSRNDEASLETIVRQIWARSTGAADLDMLPVDRPISEFADSITIMRVRDRIARETGHVLSLAALTEAGTIAKQLELLRNQELHRKVEKVTRETPGANPPGGDLVKAEDMVHVNEVFEATQTAILDTIQPHGLDWGDVMEVTPAYDFLEVSSRSDAIDSWSPKWALVCRSGISPEQVTAAIRASILKHPIFNSFFVRESESMALYVILRQKEELLGKVIVNGGKLKSEDDLISALRETIQPDPTMVPGPMAHFRLFTIEDTNSVGIIMKCTFQSHHGRNGRKSSLTICTPVNHLICDATSSQIFLDDLDTSLAAGRAAAPRQQHHTTPYKTWSDAYHRCRRSPEARAAVSWHLQHLGDLAAHRDALWPRPRPDLHENLLRASGARDAQAHAFDCTGLHGLLLRRGKLVTASVVAKTAYALATVRTTGLSHALFTSNEAARVNDVVVAGPCYTKVVNLVHVRREEALASLLRRMQRVQDDQTRCAAAPWRDVMEGLGAGAGDVLVEANWCSTFNWVPGSGVAGGAWLDHGSVVRVVGFCVRLRNGLTMACALEGSGGKERMLMDLRGTGLDAKGMASFAERFEKIVRWMCREENWHANVGQAMNVR